MNLWEKIEKKQALVGVIGLGYVGLPLVLRFCEVGFRVLGFDVDERKVEMLNRGESYIKYIPGASLQELIQPRDEGLQFSATAHLERLGEPDILIICVPTPLDQHREPDLKYVEATTRAIAACLRPGQLVSLESTTYPGTTEELVLPLLSEKLQVGEDFFLVFSPEREDPGNPSYQVKTIPKVVGGVTPDCLRHGLALYSQVVDRVVPVSTTKAAEMSKLLENIYRAVNIALVNELKLLCLRMGVDIFEVIEASKTKPFGFQAFYPGPGLGGHCIPIDPFYLTWKAREYDFATRFIELAGEINAGMPYFVVERVAAALNGSGKPLKGSQILVLGVAYKKDVDDNRESPGMKIIDILQQRGARVRYNDPHIPQCGGMRHYPHLDLQSEPLTPELLQGVDCVLLVTDHSVYDYPWIASQAPLIVDTRNAFKDQKAPHIYQA
ncbi:MAG: UDP-N-acetyl-D-glucosamine dehydrogenase [Deltaproteobacteria bacterium RBG_13_58_19]|nr:MAG: UDP-N-acetyl-D-glucosamine dehydrogenase [Deltaproteobacteria bacterium RBG_13_58_19]